MFLIKFYLLKRISSEILKVNLINDFHLLIINKKNRK